MTAAVPTLRPYRRYEPNERRALSREHRAYVIHYDGGYGVTNQGGTVKCASLDDAKRYAYAHDVACGFIADPVQLRDPERQS